MPYIVTSHFRRHFWNALSIAFVIRRTLIVMIVVALVSENSPAQQTVTYTNGETDTSAILITTATNPVTLTIASGSAIQSGAITQSDTSFYGGIAKNGNGTLTLTAVNTYTGDTDINAGTLAIGGGGSLAASANIEMTGSGATFDISGGGNQTVDILEGFAGNTVNLGANTLNIASTFSGNMEFDGTIEGSGGLAVATTQTVILAGTNTYSGGTTLNAGELAVVSSGALGTVGTISFQGGTLEFELANTTDYSSRFSTAANQHYSFDTNSELVTLAGNLNSSGGSLNKLGLGTLALTGTSTYSGATTINRGTLQLGSGGTTGKISTGSSIVDNGNLAIDRSNAVVQGTDFTSTPISGSGSFSQMGSGTTTLTTANTYTGGTIVNAGKLVLGSSGTLGSSGGSLMVNAGGTLDLNGTSQSVGNLLGTGGVILNNSTGTNKSLIIGNGNASGGVFSGVIENNSGTGGTLGLTEVGTGVAVLSGANTYTGITTISGGTLQLGNGGATGTLSTSSTIIDNGNFEINRSNSVRQGTDFTATALGGSGGLIQAGTGTTTLTSANTFTGDTLISAGTLAITGSGNLGSGNYAGSINDNGTLNFNIASNQNLSGSVYGLGTLIQSGSGTLTLSAPGEIANAIVNAGTLQLSGTGEVGDGSSNLNVNTGGTFNVNGISQTLKNLAGTGGVILNGATGTNQTLTIGSLNATGGNFAGTIENNAGTGGTLAITKVGTGSLTLSGNNNYSGPTAISMGTLEFGKETSLYNNVNSNWTAANITVSNGATLTLGVGGTGRFTATDLDTLLALATSSGGFANGSAVGFDTTNATGGNFTYGSAIVDPNGGSNVRGLTKAGTNTLTLTGASTYTGPTVISAGTLAVQGSIGNSNAVVNAGYNAGDNGALLISSGGQVTDNTGNIGTNTGSNGSATVDGTNAQGTASTWTISNNLNVGNQGTGTLTIQNGGLVTDSGGLVGATPGSNGLVTVTGANANGTASTWNNTYLSVGAQGTGTLTIQNGGVVTDSSGAVGSFAGTNGTVMVTGDNANGTPSTWNNSGNLNVGGSGTCSMTIQDGGFVSALDATVGTFSQYGVFTTSSIAVTGINSNGVASTLNVNQDLHVGQSTAGTLTITDGGRVTDNIGYVGYTLGGSGNGYSGAATVSGVNANGQASSWNSFELYVGGYNPGTLTVQNGGVVTASYIRVGQGEFAGTLNINSNGVVATNAITLYSDNGGGVTFNGGILRATSDTFTGYYNLLQGGTVTLGSGGGTIDNNGHSVDTSNSVITGSGGLISTGMGTFTLNGVNTYTGATTITSGTLYVAGSIVSSAVHVSNGASLAGTGTTGFVTINAGGKINLQDGQIGTLTVGGLNAGNAATPSSFSFDIQTVSGSTSVDKIMDSGSLTLSGTHGTTITINSLSGTSTLTNASNTYALLTYTGTQRALSDFLLATTTLDGKNLSLSETGDTLYLNVSGITADVILTTPGATYDGSSHPATATTNPSSLAVTITYNGSTTAPTNAGTYAVLATINDSTYSGSTSGTLVISQAAATVTLNNQAVTYNGTPQSLAATTNPPGLDVTTTYNGSSTPPAAPGTYTVVGTVNDTNYQGNGSGTLTISKPNFGTWADEYFTPQQLTDITISGPAAMPEKDGVPNLLKYLYNIRPGQTMDAADRAALPVFATNTGGNLTLTFREFLAQTGITLHVETSADLQSWTPLTQSTTLGSSTYTMQPTGVTDPNTGDSYMQVQVQATGSTQFIRLNVTSP